MKVPTVALVAALAAAAYPRPGAAADADAEMGAQIVGGGLVSDARYRFTVSLQKQNRETGAFEHFCGASLVHRKWVMTAAHCVVDGAPDRLVVGAFDLDDEESGVVRFAARTVYPKSHRGVKDDIALMHLSEAVDDIEPLHVHRDAFAEPAEMEGQMLRVVGWGRVKEEAKSFEKRLRQVDVPLVGHSECRKSYLGLDDGKLCAGFRKGKFDACGGDSGGPLFFDNGEHIVQVGIVSYGIGCARKRFYGVYARNSYYFEDFLRVTLEFEGDSLRPMPYLEPPTPEPTLPPVPKKLRRLTRFCAKRNTYSRCMRVLNKCYWSVQGAKIIRGVLGVVPKAVGSTAACVSVLSDENH